jgi:hypothetical protein
MNNLDDLFKNKLEQNGLEFQEEYWKDMEGLIDQENKKKRRFILFFSGLFVILIGSIIGLTLNGNNKNEKLAVISSTPAAETDTISIPKNNSESQLTIENQIAQVENNKLNTSVNHTQKAKPKQHYHISKTEQTTLNTNTLNTLSDYTNSNKAIYQSSNTVTENSAIITNDSDFGIETDDKDNLVFADFMRFNPTKIELEKILPHTCKNCAHGLKLDPEKTKEKANWVYQFGLSAIYNFNNRTALNSNYEKSKNTIGYKASFSASKKHWGLKTGLEYYKYQEQNNYPNSSKSYTFDTSYSLINAFYSYTPKGTRIALIGRKIDTTESLNTYFTSTTLGLQYISIPLHGFYTTALGKFSFQVEAGINTGFLIRKTGSYSNLVQGNYVARPAAQSNEFKTLMIQSYIGITLSYPVYKQFSLQSSFGMQNGMSTYHTNSESKLNRMNLGLGLVYTVKQ